VEFIGKKCFAGCKYLGEVVFEPESELREIGDFAFQDTRVERLEIPAKCKILSVSSLVGVKSLTICEENGFFELQDSFLVNRSRKNVLLRYAGSEAQVLIKKEVEVIGQHCFCRHELLQGVEFEQGCKLREIGDYAFSVTGLCRITIPVNVIVIGEWSFSKCHLLKEVEFEAGSKLQRIRKKAFESSGIERITIPANVEVIEKRCFSESKFLQEVTFERESKLREIHMWAFCGTALAKLEIPAKCEVLHEGALMDVKNISVSPGNECFKMEDSFLVDQRLNVLLHYCGSAAEVIVKKEIEGLGEGCFFRNKTIRKLSFEAGSQLVWIGAYVFARSSLVEMRIPSTIDFIHQLAFAGSWIGKITFYKVGVIPPKYCRREQK
jgi:hypothetical protein